VSKKSNEASLPKNKSLMIGLVSTMILILVVLLGYVIVTKVDAYNERKKTMEEFREYVNQEEVSLVYYMHTGCQFCAMEEPILEQISMDYDLKYLTIDSNDLSGKDKNEVLNTLGIEGKTPTLVVMKNGHSVATHIGYADGYKLVEFFIKAELLDEGSTYKPEENLNVLDYKSFEEMKASDETYVLTIGSSTCDYCKAARPTLSNIAKAYNIDIYYVSLDYLSKEERNQFFQDLEDLKYDDKTFTGEGKMRTPSVLVVKNKRVVEHLEGLEDVTAYVKFFKEQKVIKDA